MNQRLARWGEVGVDWYTDWSRFHIDKGGFWFHTRWFDVSYWSPGAWVPLSMRDRQHWWGAFRLERGSVRKSG